MVIGDSRSAAVFLDSRLRLVGQDIAEILDLDLGIVHVTGDVSRVRDGPTPYDCYLHGKLPPYSTFWTYYIINNPGRDYKRL